MRLWHEDLIPLLPRQQLLGQHRECCALRGKGWGKKHSTVNYVFDHTRLDLALYHVKVLREMERRGYKPDKNWYRFEYRGKNCPVDTDEYVESMFKSANVYLRPIYPEHDDKYLKDCLDNLERKGIHIDMGSVENMVPLARKLVGSGEVFTVRCEETGSTTICSISNELLTEEGKKLLGITTMKEEIHEEE